MTDLDLIGVGDHQPRSAMPTHCPPSMLLSGDNNTPAMPMTEAQVNHLRRLLAWMRCEMGQEPAEMVVMANNIVAKVGPLQDPGGAMVRLQEGYDKAASYPAYLRQAVKMLTKALLDHERGAGIVDASL